MECRRRSIDVPRDISILGFGDFGIAAQCVPAISTISVDPRRIGALIGERIIEHIEHGKAASHAAVPRLIERESTGARTNQ